jgi:hypothetical protein
MQRIPQVIRRAAPAARAVARAAAHGDTAPVGAPAAPAAPAAAAVGAPAVGAPVVGAPVVGAPVVGAPVAPAVGAPPVAAADAFGHNFDFNNANIFEPAWRRDPFLQRLEDRAAGRNLPPSLTDRLLDYVFGRGAPAPPPPAAVPARPPAAAPLARPRLAGVVAHIPVGARGFAAAAGRPRGLGPRIYTPQAWEIIFLKKGINPAELPFANFLNAYKECIRHSQGRPLLYCCNRYI